MSPSAYVGDTAVEPSYCVPSSPAADKTSAPSGGAADLRCLVVKQHERGRPWSQWASTRCVGVDSRCVAGGDDDGVK